MSGPHLSDAVRRAARAHLTSAVGTARRKSRQSCPHVRRRRLAPHALVPTASSTAPPSRPKPRRTDRRCSPDDIAPRRRPCAGEPPISRPSPTRRRRATASSSSSAAAELGRARCAGRGRGPRTRAAPAPRARAAPRVAMGRAPAWPWAAPALCNWAERGFGPVAPG
jgi:hypothetical protein